MSRCHIATPPRGVFATHRVGVDASGWFMLLQYDTIPVRPPVASEVVMSPLATSQLVHASRSVTEVVCGRVLEDC